VTAPTDRWTADEDDAAVRLDLAIDAVLASRSDPPDPTDDSLAGTAGLLGSQLPRLHPRFGFEERLAQRLRGEADDVHGTILEFPSIERGSGLAGTIDPAWRPGRWSLIGAVASGISVAITLAGAVFLVLWRRARGSRASEGVA
jgi:hypothetical protein